MPWKSDGIREELKDLRTAYEKAGHRLTDKLTIGLDDIRREHADLRQTLGDTVSAGFAEPPRQRPVTRPPRTSRRGWRRTRTSTSTSPPSAPRC